MRGLVLVNACSLGRAPPDDEKWSPRDLILPEGVVFTGRVQLVGKQELESFGTGPTSRLRVIRLEPPDVDVIRYQRGVVFSIPADCESYDETVRTRQASRNRQ